MRVVYLAVIILLAAAAVIFALQNLTSVSVSFLGFSVTMPLAVLVVVIYVLGAATGGSLFALKVRGVPGDLELGSNAPEETMWVLVYVFSFNVMPSTQIASGEWQMNPNVIFQEFSSEASCKAVKDSVTATLKDSASSMKSRLGDLREGGVIGDNFNVIFSVECFPK
jgi:hypothetical protein